MDTTIVCSDITRTGREQGNIVYRDNIPRSPMVFLHGLGLIGCRVLTVHGGNLAPLTVGLVSF